MFVGAIFYFYFHFDPIARYVTLIVGSFFDDHQKQPNDPLNPPTHKQTLTDSFQFNTFTSWSAKRKRNPNVLLREKKYSLTQNKQRKEREKERSSQPKKTPHFVFTHAQLCHLSDLLLPSLFPLTKL